MDKLLQKEVEAVEDMAELTEDMAELTEDMAELTEDMAELTECDLNEAFSALAENILMYNLMREDGWYYG